MSTQVQYRYGTASQNDAFTGALAEITVDTTNGTLRVHNGVAAGGSNIATVAYVTTQISSLSANSITFGTSNVSIPSTGGNIRVNVGGSSNVVVWATTGEYVTGVVSASGNITGGNLSGTNIVGTITTASQPNITSVGTLGALSVSGAVTAASVVGGGISLVGNTISSSGSTLTLDPAAAGITGLVIVAGNLQVQGTTTTIDSTTLTTNDLLINMANNAATASAADGGGIGVGPAGTEYAKLTYNSTANIWVATNGLSVVGNITGSNIATGGAMSITGGSTAGSYNTTGNITGGNILTGGLISATTTITSAANITGGNILTGGLISATTTITGAGNITGGNILTNGIISSAGSVFGTVFSGKATTAQYADLAEMYCADANYPPGTVVEFGGTSEITITTASHSTQVAGIISTNPAYLMNSILACEVNALEVALVGRVPCSVVGTIRKGDRLVSSKIPGVAQAVTTDLYQPGCIIGKALEEYNSTDPGVIEVAVGRL